MTIEHGPSTRDVTIAVPTDRAYRFQDFADRWLKGTAHTEWRAADHDLAVELWHGLCDRRRRLLGVLIDNPGRRFRSTELVKLTGEAVTPRTLIGLLGHVSTLSERLCRAWPWQYDYPQGKGPGRLAIYWFEPDIAELFRSARATVEGAQGSTKFDSTTPIISSIEPVMPA